MWMRRERAAIVGGGGGDCQPTPPAARRADIAERILEQIAGTRAQTDTAAI
ncbi:MAG: hypothetical protein AcusKO_07250 [Acuticoccus sp.]